MGRARREIYSGQMYEICMRTLQGLPFVCRLYMEMILKGIIARVQRDMKVTLCHHLWMANHAHMIIIAKDQAACKKFYGEIQKQITEAVKRLLGLKHLKLWKSNGTSVIPINDIDTASYRIAYIYANPATANLVDSILDYPGISTYKDFMKDLESFDVSHIKECPWVRQPMINQLPEAGVTRVDDLNICKEWEDTATESHELVTNPNAWMNCFGITEPEKVIEVNDQILKYLTGLEKNARDKREEKKQKVMGKKALIARQIHVWNRATLSPT